MTEVRRLLLNACSPMEVTEEGIVTDVKPLFLNALFPMEVTEEEIVRLLARTLPPVSLVILITEPSDNV